MRDEPKTKIQLVRELRTLRAKLRKLDKTEEKRRSSEDTLQESEERYRRLVEGSPDAIAVHSEGKFVFVNPAGAKLVGAQRPQELIGKPILDIVHPDSRSRVIERIQQVAKGKKAPLYEEQFVKLDGTVIDVDVVGIPCTYQGKTATQVIVRDITERKLAEESIKSQIILVNSIINSVKDTLILALDKNYRYLAFNENHRQEMKRVYNANIEVGKCMLDYVNVPKVKPLAKASFDRVLRGESFTEIQQQPSLDIWYEFDWSPINSAEGEVIGINVFVRNITERKKREEEQAYNTRLHKFRSEMAYSVNRQLPLGEILQQSAEVITRNLDLACAHIWIVNRETNSVELQAHAELSTLRTDPDECIRIGRLLASSVVAEGRMIASNSILDGPSLIDATWARRRSIIAYVGLPLLVEDQIVGVLTIFADTPLLEPKLSPLAGSAVTLAQGIMRKRAEDNLRQSEDRYRDLVEHSQDLICTHDLDGRLLTVNSRAVKMLGYSLDEIAKMNMRDILAPEVRRLFDRYLRKISRDHSAEGQLIVQTKSGDRRIWEYENTLRTEGVAKPFVRGWARDITERKRAEEALMQGEAKWRSLVSHSPDFIALHDREGRFLFLNHYAEGFTEKGVLGKKVYEFVSPESREQFTTIFEECVRTMTKQHFEYSAMGDSAKARMYEGTFVPMISSGNEVNVLVVAKDITERKQAEEDLKQALEWQEAIFEGSRDAIFISDQDSRFVAVNKAACDLTAYSREKLLKMRIPDVHDHPDLEAYKTYHQRIFAGEEILSEAKILRSDGGKVDTEFSNKRVSIAGRLYMHTTARDITERKQAEVQIEILSRFPTENPNPVLRIAPEGVIRYANDASEPLLGMWNVQIGQVMPDDWCVRIADVFKSGQRKEIEVRCGQQFFSCILAPVVGAGYVNVYCGDVTKRKQAEEAVWKSEERLRDIIFSLADWVWEVDKDGIYTYSSQKGFDLFGPAHDDVIGKTPFDLMPPDEAKRVGAIFSDLAANKLPIKDLENWNISKKGETICLLTNGVPILDDQGNLKGYRGVDKDITERKQMEESLKKERALLSTIIETIPDEICLKDTNSRYMMANKASMTALGAKSLEEMIGKTDLEYVRPEMALRHIAEEKAILESGEPTISRERVRLDPKTGEISKCDLSTKVPVKDEEGNAIALLVINKDITDRKRAEENVRRSALRLRMLSAHLESVREEERKHIAQEFHDQLGQTLTALKMDLSLLERGLADEKKEMSRVTLIEEIRSSQGLIDRGIQTVRAIMSELRPELLDQLGLVEALEWEVGKFQQRSGVLCGLIAEVGDLQFDGRRSIALFRLVQEALTNVARHAQATRVDVIIRTEGDDLILEIKDDGIGITFDAENKPRSFGLIGMRERALFLGGNLEITGIMGKGTTIAVRMPIHETLPDGGG
jgi:PAS domain S-box-containing protein